MRQGGLAGGAGRQEARMGRRAVEQTEGVSVCIDDGLGGRWNAEGGARGGEMAMRGGGRAATRGGVGWRWTVWSKPRASRCTIRSAIRELVNLSQNMVVVESGRSDARLKSKR
eukprot:6204962-Pleurochrysis_carterae.AAC.1